MSSAHPDRIKLATGATTIVRAPVGRGKSGSGTAAFWSSLPELNSRDQLDRNGSTEQVPGMPPIPGAGPLLWRDAVIASSGNGDASAASALRGPTRKGLLAGGPSRKSVAGMGSGSGGGGGGGGGAAAGVSFRRNGVASAPIVSTASTSAGGTTEGADAERRRLPAITGGSRSAAASASGTAPPGGGTGAVQMPPGGLPPALKGASRRVVVSLPSIHGAVSTTIDSGPGDSPEDEPPIVVSFVPSRPTSGNRAVRRGLSRAAISFAAGSGNAAGGAAGAGGTSAGGGGAGRYDEASAEASTANSLVGALVRGGGGGGNGALFGGGGLLRGIRRFFGKESTVDGGTTPRAIVNGGGGGGGGGNVRSTAANSLDDTVRQDDTASSAQHVQRSPTSVAKLAYEHVREQERMNRVRSSLLAVDVRAGARAEALSAVTMASPSGGGGGGGNPILSPMGPHKFEEGRALRSGKSFTQRALEDPENPAFKTVKQLAALQDKMSYMDDPDWREKAAEMVTMERPILMAEGWKV